MNTANTPTSPQRSRYFLPLFLAACWNVVIGGLIGLNLKLISPWLFVQPHPLAAIFNDQAFWTLVVAFGIGYGVAAFYHHRCRLFLSVGGVLKIILFSAFAYLWAEGVITTLFLMAGVGDFLWALYFFWFLQQTKEYGYW